MHRSTFVFNSILEFIISLVQNTSIMLFTFRYLDAWKLIVREWLWFFSCIVDLKNLELALAINYTTFDFYNHILKHELLSVPIEGIIHVERKYVSSINWMFERNIRFKSLFLINNLYLIGKLWRSILRYLTADGGNKDIEELYVFGNKRQIVYLLRRLRVTRAVLPNLTVFMKYSRGSIEPDDTEDEYPNAPTPVTFLEPYFPIMFHSFPALQSLKIDFLNDRTLLKLATGFRSLSKIVIMGAGGGGYPSMMYRNTISLEGFSSFLQAMNGRLTYISLSHSHFAMLTDHEIHPQDWIHPLATYAPNLLCVNLAQCTIVQNCYHGCRRWRISINDV